MAVINGTMGADTLSGTSDADFIYGFAGKDLLYGGDGNDYLSGGTGMDTVYGGAGDDHFVEDYGPNKLYGGDGNDLIEFWSGTGALANGGAGDDHFTFYGAGGVLSGGAGRDTYEPLDYFTSVTIKDFAAGPSGDVIDLGKLLEFDGYAGVNPFADGYLRLVQSGASTEVQFDWDGPAPTGVFATIFTLSNVTTTSLMAANFAGLPTDGSAPSPHTVTGTVGDDALTGLATPDTLYGLGGRDTIYGGAGNDIMFGGDGADSLYGGQGSDQVYGGAGNDYLETLAGVDTMDGGDGDDTIFVQAGTPGALVYGGGGDDLIETGGGAATLSGGAGQDIYQILLWGPISEAVITDFETGAGGDLVDLGISTVPSLIGYHGGNPFADGHFRLVQDGADAVLQMDQDGHANGAAFVDLVRFSSVAISSLTADNLGYAPDGSLQPGKIISGTGGDDSITGGVNADTISGLAGNDTLNGSDGDDVIYGGDGNDVIVDSMGANQMYGGAGADLLAINDYDSPGSSLYGGDGDDRFEALSSGTTMAGGAGEDTYYIWPFADVTITDFQPGDSGDVANLALHFTPYFPSSAKTFFGADLRLTQHGADAWLEGAINGLPMAVIARFEGVTASSLTAHNFGGYAPYVLSILGTSSNNLLMSTSEGETIDGKGGTDTVGYQAVGAAVNVSLAITTWQNTGGGGTDTLVSIENLIGSPYADRLSGSAGVNEIYGGSGDDTITGGTGADHLYGGAGADTFIYAALSDSSAGAGVDKILDFSHAEGDRIDLSAIDANTTLSGDQAFTLTGTFTHAAGQLIELAKTGGWLVEGDVNGDAKPDFAIFVGAASAPGAGDFIL
jgi:Ca2+-binding RTX toxin-like protein